MIKTTVNLFSVDLLPAKLRLSFERMMLAAAAVVVLSLIAWGVGFWLESTLASQHGALSKQKLQLDNQKAALELQLSTRQPDADLVAKVELEQQRLELKQLLSDEIKQRDNMISHGYAGLLTDLASVSDSSVWLNRIVINQQYFEFEGFGSHPQSIPLWVERLKTTETLKGYAFATMTMDRGENQPLAFKLASTAEQGAKQ
ncbi:MULTISPECIES: fimbrial assembly protein [unclassified Shewanella]|uniref:fimbrial assembly protein n=1 Tax=unclassified Shewanella TaxID=196818 RepID=UPI000C84A4A7|nr:MULTISPECIES: fimbrial assembly protein [unclassified Shewanella]PMH85306.1 fimbrial assembly protein [Shewanella sp. 10N.286.48.B5]PMH98150.1 fimbrial assembly protein [Shewanella sp. 10N.286.48.A6]